MALINSAPQRVIYMFLVVFDKNGGLCNREHITQTILVNRIDSVVFSCDFF